LILVGVPALLFGTGFLLRPIQLRTVRRRDQQADLTGRAADIVAGLRVLRGIGGERAFAARYRRDSQQVRESGVHVAKLDSVLQQAGVLFPGLLTLGVLWLGAGLAVNGNLSAGQLVSLYSYAAFLGLPMHTVTFLIESLIAGRVAAGRIRDVLRLEPIADGQDAGDVVPAGSQSAKLVDPVSGLVVRPAVLTVVASRDPEDGSVLADRLGRYVGSDVSYAGRRLADCPVEWVREHILVDNHQSRLFSGRLIEEFGDASPDRIAAALHVANAQNIVDALPNGLDSTIAEGGMNFSGGEKQRLQLARALLADSAVLVLVDPTSAVDASSEATIVERLRTARAGQTTVIVSSSPLVLDRADEVVFIDSGTVVGVGTHRELLHTVPGYASMIVRERA
jgi:ABC-type multidrug transport system fused ATPase/permease subunit